MIWLRSVLAIYLTNIIVQLHRHAVSNSKRGIPVDDKGTLDDEVSIVSSDVCYPPIESMLVVFNSVTRHHEKVTPISLPIELLEKRPIKFGTLSKPV